MSVMAELLVFNAQLTGRIIMAECIRATVTSFVLLKTFVVVLVGLTNQINIFVRPANILFIIQKSEPAIFLVSVT